MASPSTTITCPTSCSDPLPPASFSLCNPTTNLGEIEEILYTNVGNPMTDESDPSEWATRKALADAAPNKIHSVFGKFEKPASDGSEIEIARNVKIAGVQTHNITGNVFETNATNYESHRKFHCSRKVLIWYRTAGGLLYGGASGIEASITMKEVIPGTRKELIYFTLNATWDAKIPPNRTASPF